MIPNTYFQWAEFNSIEFLLHKSRDRWRGIRKVGRSKGACTPVRQTGRQAGRQER